jgi:hypothetical protein
VKWKRQIKGGKVPNAIMIVPKRISKRFINILLIFCYPKATDIVEPVHRIHIVFCFAEWYFSI